MLFVGLSEYCRSFRNFPLLSYSNIDEAEVCPRSLSIATIWVVVKSSTHPRTTTVSNLAFLPVYPISRFRLIVYWFNWFRSMFIPR